MPKKVRNLENRSYHLIYILEPPKSASFWRSILPQQLKLNKNCYKNQRCPSISVDFPRVFPVWDHVNRTHQGLGAVGATLVAWAGIRLKVGNAVFVGESYGTATFWR
jgi:hypothetical protein